MPIDISSRPTRCSACSPAIPRRWPAPSRSSSAAASRSTSWPTSIPKSALIPSLTPQQTLEKLTWEGAAWRYPEGLPDDVAQTLRHELRLIEKLDYAPYFLTVHSIVRFARSKDILCQGRGSAANSAVCYVLGITSIDPGHERPPVRALRVGGTPRAARHRRRFRARAARDRHAVDLRARMAAITPRCARPSSAIAPRARSATSARRSA